MQQLPWVQGTRVAKTLFKCPIILIKCKDLTDTTKPVLLRSLEFARLGIPLKIIPTVIIGISFPVAEYDHISNDKQGIWSLQIMRDETIN